MKTVAVVSLLAACCLVASAPAQEQKPVSPQDRAPTAPKVKRIGVEEFDKLRLNKTNIVLDVRTAREFKSGHIPGAVNLDIRSPDFDKRVTELDKSKTYLVHCAAGGRSARACKEMEGMGFKELYDLQPGFMGWEKAGKPIEK